jgi:hypothetical protein
MPSKRDLLSEAARAMQAARKTRAGGRPQSSAPRCPCGAMTLARATSRKHKCVPPALADK